MYLILSRQGDPVESRLQLPATLEEVRQNIAQLDQYSTAAGPVRATGLDSPIQNLWQYIQKVNLHNEVEMNRINTLSYKIDRMSEREHSTFSGALDMEQPHGLGGVMHTADSSDEYEFTQGVTSDMELGGWLVEHGLAGVEFPEQVRPYLDYAGIGAAYYSDHGGAYTAHGYVKRRETAQIQAVNDKPAFNLTLASSHCEAHCLDLPATGSDLEQAKSALKLDNLDAAMIDELNIGYSWAHLLPREGFTVDDANTMAQYVRAMSDTQLQTFGAALETEEPTTFTDAVCIAEDIDNYELVDVTEGEYARDGLRMAGAGNEIFDLLDGYTDYERMGQAMMEEDGVQETAYGPVKRLSAPFPQQTEMGQTMY